MSDMTERLARALAARYEIRGVLGVGGMATVFLAHDVKHDRKVAVKVLRPELAAVLGAERFLNEIKVTANLQHPNILALYDSGEADSFLYYVMPYIEGESLRAKLNREKQLSIEESIEVAKAVANALDYAHRHEVIHRDIKPENILLHDGQALVADFGIALAVSAAGGTRLTATGLSLGTPHYMSPEQASADRELDGRTDVYSLGATLYEMLLGEPPFTGASAQAVVAKILTEEPGRVTAARQTVPQNVEVVIHKALAKLPADRFATASQFADALTNPSAVLASPVAAAATPGATPLAALAMRHRWLGWAIPLSLAIFAAAALWSWLRPAPSVHPVPRRYVLSLPQDHRLDVRSPAALSPDGTHLVYAAGEAGRSSRRQLYVRALDEFEARPIAGTDGGESPFFSPDGQWVGFWARGALRKVPLDGGPPLTIAETGQLYGVSWGPGDRIVLAEVVSGLRQVPAGGGVPEVLTDLGDDIVEIAHYSPEILPGGAAVLFASTAAGPGSHRIGVASLNTGEWKVLVEGGLAPRYSPTGHIVFVGSDGLLWAVGFDLSRLELTGEPSRVSDRTVLVTQGDQALYAVADDGTLVFVAAGQAGQGHLVWVDRAAAVTPLPFPPQQYLHPRLSPDGRRVAVTIREPDEGRQAIWVLDLDRATRTLLTVEGEINRWPVWTHEGTRIAFTSTRGGSLYDLFWKPVDGSGNAQRLLTSENVKIPISWATPRQTLAYYEMFGYADIWTLPPDGEPSALETTPFDERSPMFSPDGRWLAYVSNESGQDEVYARPYPGPGSRVLISTDGGVEPVWSRDGRELYYRQDEQMMVVSIEQGAALAPGAPRVLFTAPYTFGVLYRGNPSYDVSPDGRFLMIRSEADDTMSPRLHVVLNWFEELKAKVGNE